jgi:hypothetical protein
MKQKSIQSLMSISKDGKLAFAACSFIEVEIGSGLILDELLLLPQTYLKFIGSG